MSEELNKDLSNLEIISSKFNGPFEFLNDPYVNEIIEKVYKKNIDKKTYSYIINSMINSLKCSGDTKQMLKKIFEEKSTITISNYRKFLRYYSLKRWEIYKKDNCRLYENLGQKITDYIKTHSVESTMHFFEVEFRNISTICEKSIDSIELLLKRIKTSIDYNDIVNLSNEAALLKDLIRRFNLISKEKFIYMDVSKNVEFIRDYFKIESNQKQSFNNVIKINLYIDLLFKDPFIRTSIRNKINEFYDEVIDSNDLKEIIKNILIDNHKSNLEKFCLQIPANYSLFYSTKSYNRLNQNYMKKVNDSFDINQLDIINNYLFGSVEQRNHSKMHLTKENIFLLEQIRPLLIESSSYFDIKDNKIVLVSNLYVLSIDEEKEIKKYNLAFNKYLSLCSSILRPYKQLAEFRKNLEVNNKSDSNLSFTDDNYKFDITKSSKLLNLKFIAKILDNLDLEKLDNMTIKDSDISKIKKLLITDGLLASLLVESKDETIIPNILNNIDIININSFGNNFNIDNLHKIIEKTNSFLSHTDEFTLALLSDEVCEKIINSTEFLQGSNTEESIRIRLNRAVKLMLATQDIKFSSVPYFEDEIYEDIVLHRYLNNDPTALTSGIDSQTCFKIAANDNDYLFYSLANKNGFIIQILQDGKMIGRATAHAYANMIMINGLRTADNNYISSSLDDVNKNKKMIKALKNLGNKIIELTSDNNCPVDFVVSNKAGILESPEFDGMFDILPEHIFTRHIIDTNNDDFDLFVHDFKDCLQQAQYYTKADEVPFQTDFGSYPIVMISNREGKYLNKMWDIAFDTPNAIYQRPNKKISGQGKLSLDLINKINRINALKYYKDGKDISKFKRVDYSDIVFKKYIINDNGYYLEKDNEIIEVDLNDDEIKKLVKKISD